jgi:pentatricopeptide repeat protein
MYCACGGLLEDAIAVFESLAKPDVVAWTAMIGAYAQHDLGDEAAICFSRMLHRGIEPNEITFVCVLEACEIDAKLVHHQIAEAGIRASGDLGTALIDMYGKHGMGLQEARAVFRGAGDWHRDIVCWNAMLAAYAQQGYGEEALELYRALEQEQEEETDLRPNVFTFVGVLGACGHGGLVEPACRCFASMRAELCIEHCICVVDLLGRAGRLDDAHRFAEQMPLLPSATLWMSLLGSCKLHHDLERGKLAAENVRQLDPRSVRACVLLSNIHASTRAAAEEETHPESSIDP